MTLAKWVPSILMILEKAFRYDHRVQLPQDYETDFALCQPIASLNYPVDQIVMTLKATTVPFARNRPVSVATLMCSRARHRRS